MSNKEEKVVAETEEKKYKIVVKDCTSKDGKKKFKTYKLVDEENGGRLTDCVMCKTINATQLEELNSCKKAWVAGDISINTTGYEYPKAFIRSLNSVEKIV